MAKLTISDAARACRIARSTLQRAVNAGRLSLDGDHRVNTAERLRAGYPRHAARQEQDRSTRQGVLQDAAGLPPPAAALMQHTIAALERENALLRAALDAAATREQEARTNAQATREERALLLQMLQEMPHRYDRLLEAPRSAPAPASPVPGAASDTSAPRGELRRRIVALLGEYPDGLSPVQTRHLLGMENDLGSTMKAMVRDGVLRRIATGVYVAREAGAGE
jgi:hypothetical protein